MKSKNTKNTKNTVTALATLNVELQVDQQKAPSELQLTPAGFFRAKDGRPTDLPDGWYIDESIARNVIDQAYYINDRVIDYEHQTLLTDQNGQPAPAAGWFSRFQWRETGLWATNVTWTPSAQQKIINKEYRYLSPVIEYDPKTGHVLDVVMAALTNNPAIDGMQQLAPLTAKSLYQQQRLNTKNGEKEMKLSGLLSVLGLPDGATEKEALKALSDLKEKAQTAAASVAALTAQVESLTEKRGTDVDPAKFVPIEVVKEMQSTLAALSAQTNHNAINLMINKALESGCLLPSQKEWATELGKKDLAALSNFIKNAEPVIALTAQQQGAKTRTETKHHVAGLTADQQLIREVFGTSVQDFK